MGDSEEDGVLVSVADVEVESACALVVWHLQQCDGDTKCGCEGLEELRGGVVKGVEGEQLGACSDRQLQTR